VRCRLKYNGRIFFIGLTGFNISFFIYFFDVNKFTTSEGFRNFTPINLPAFNEQQLRSIGVKPIIESIGNNDIIQVIP
jgi:hypothetical protein